MMALIAFYWYGLLIAFGIGLATGWWTWGHPVAALVEFDPHEESVDRPETDLHPIAMIAEPEADADAAPPEEPEPAAVEQAEGPQETSVPPLDEPQPVVPSDVAPEAPADSSQAADDLMMIKGIGPALARLLNSLGVRRFDDIASWMPDDIELIESHLGEFRGRIIRDEWIQQARLLARGDMETFNQRYGHLRF